MDFKPSPERQILFDTLKKYFENEYSLSDRNIAAHSDLGYSKKAWEAMRDLGILETLIDPEFCLLYTSPSPRDRVRSRMPSSA